MQAAPTISVLAYCDNFNEKSPCYFQSVLSQTHAEIELIISEQIASNVQKLPNSNSINIQTIAASDQPAVWYKNAFAKAGGEIIVFTSSKIQYVQGSFAAAASVFECYPQCGALHAQISLGSHPGEDQFDPYDVIPLFRYDRLPRLEQLFLSKTLCENRIDIWEVEENRLGAVFAWMMHDVPMVVSHETIGNFTDAVQTREMTIESILSDCKKRLSYQNRFSEKYFDNEVVHLFGPYAKTEILCHAAENVERIEGVSEQFRDIVQRAGQFSKGSYRLEQLQAKITGQSSKTDAFNELQPVDPNFRAKNWWDSRYASGGHSGAGSYDANYSFKRDYINAVIRRFKIQSIIDFGCGDGSQIKQIDVAAYQGIDISSSVVNRCRKLYEHNSNFSFDVYDEFTMGKYDLAMSLDVLYHVVEPDQYDLYLNRLFSHSRYSLIYANAIPRSDNTAHMLFRDHIYEIRRRGFPVRMIEKVMNPLIPTVGFLLYENVE